MPIPADVRPIERVRTRERALDVIRNWIISGDLAPGEPVRDADLAVALGVSRTPVRVALIELERDGLIHRDSAGHVHVAPIDLDDLERIIPVRVELESLAARLAAESGPTCLASIQEANAHLRRLAAVASGSLEPSSIQAVREANDRFHLTILSAAGNHYLSEHLGGLRVLHRRYETLYFTSVDPVAQSSADDHEEIIAAIGVGDSNAAADAMRRHLNRAWDLVSRLRGEEIRGIMAV